MGVLAIILTVILFLLSAMLIFVVSAQTPKNEGFGGGVTNTPGGNFRGKAGFDDVLSNYTRIIAIAWIATALLVGVVQR
jgi:protein translocase SecG subunit